MIHYKPICTTCGNNLYINWLYLIILFDKNFNFNFMFVFALGVFQINALKIMKN